MLQLRRATTAQALLRSPCKDKSNCKSRHRRRMCGLAVEVPVRGRVEEVPVSRYEQAEYPCVSPEASLAVEASPSAAYYSLEPAQPWEVALQPLLAQVCQ